MLSKISFNLYAAMLDEEGQGTSEYAVILGIIVIAAIALISAFGDQLSTAWGDITGGFTW